MSLPLDVSSVLSYFYRRVTYFERVYRVINFEGTFVQQPDRIIVGVLIPPTDRDIQFFDEGEIATGAIVLYCSSKYELYYADAIVENESYRQSFIRLGTDIYRIKGCSDRAMDGRHRKYTGVRYVQRNNR